MSVKILGKTNIRAMWRMACMWRRYRGFSGRNTGSIAVNPTDACFASTVMPIVTGEDKLASKRSGSNLKTDFDCFFN